MVEPARPATKRAPRWGALGLVVVAVVALVSLAWMALDGPGARRDPSRAPPGERAAAAASERAQWSALLEALDREIEARKELEREVAELRDALTAAGLLDETPAWAHSDSPDPLASAQASGEAAEAEAFVAAGPRPGFDAEALVAAGLDPARAAALRERWEELELEKLYLRDQAAREGWMVSPRHRMEQDALVSRLREEIGDEDYAALLYATGAPNTVEVTDVLARSPADDAGLAPGDEILRYDGVRVFRPNALRQATATGEPGEFVPIEVMRDGRPVTFRVRRGPLGVLLRGATRPPPP